MANSKSNWPAAQNPDVKPGEMSVMVKLINDIRELERPKTDGEVEQRISAFFQWCIDNDVRPGVELMALSLGNYTSDALELAEGGRKERRDHHAGQADDCSTDGELGPDGKDKSCCLLLHHEEQLRLFG